MDGDEALPVSEAAEPMPADGATGAPGWQPMPEGWRPRALVWRPWRWRAFLDPVQWALAAVVVVVAIGMLAGMTVSIFLLTDAVKEEDLSVPAAVAICVAALVGGGGLGAWFIRAMLRAGARRFARRLPPDIAGEAFVQACVLSRDQPREGWTATGRKEWLANLRAGTDAAACLDPYAAQAAAAIPRIPDRIEPERIGGSSSVRVVRVLVGLSIFGAWLLWRSAGGWSSMVMPGVMLAVAAFGILRLATSGRLTAPMTVGPGWAKWGDLSWSVHDSVLLVERIASRTVQATFVGPAGLVRLRLRTDPGLDGHFATLWTRWMHDRPEAPGTGLDE